MTVVRKAVIGEEGSILSFYEQLIDLLRDAEFRPTWKKGVYPTLTDIRSAVEHCSMYVAVDDDGSIVGAVICNHTQGTGYDEVPWTIEAACDRVAVIHLLAVDPRQHGRGTGRALLQKAAEDSRARGDAVIRLDTLPWNKPAHRLYESFGFQWRGDYPLSYPSVGTISFSMYEYILVEEEP